VPCYPSDLTDEQWAVLEPRAREVMRELTVAVGRPMIHDLRAMCDAVSYVVRNGVEWRALPADFPPWEAVYAFWERWNGRGLPLELIRRLREMLRQHQGRAAQPSACIVDSQIVKCADTVGKKTSGYHGGKKITGRGRRETAADQAVRPVQHPEDHVGRQRVRRGAAGPVCPGRRRHHRRGR
jgi:transposase